MTPYELTHDIECEGYDAFFVGTKQHQNPHDGEDAKLWDRGWLEAREYSDPKNYE